MTEAHTSNDYKRVELVWPGKKTEVERVKLPFQVIERVNDVRRSNDAARGHREEDRLRQSPVRQRP
jgi:hypothetical protein